MIKLTATFSKEKINYSVNGVQTHGSTICYKIQLEPCFTPYKNVFQITIMLNKNIEQLDKSYSSNLRWEKELLNIKAKKPMREEFLRFKSCENIKTNG